MRVAIGIQTARVDDGLLVYVSGIRKTDIGHAA